jgi:hypothetical protein
MTAAAGCAAVSTVAALRSVKRLERRILYKSCGGVYMSDHETQLKKIESNTLDNPCTAQTHALMIK